MHVVAKDFTTRHHAFKAGDPVTPADMDHDETVLLGITRVRPETVAAQQTAFDHYVAHGFIRELDEAAQPAPAAEPQG